MKNTRQYPISALIVDDEKDICFLLNNILKQKSIRVRQAGSLAEAETSMQQELPAVIFLDNHLPDGLGVDYITKFKNQNPGGKIIMITAHDTDKDQKKAQLQGVDYFISKPFTRDIIYGALTNLKWSFGE